MFKVNYSFNHQQNNFTKKDSNFFELKNVLIPQKFEQNFVTITKNTLKTNLVHSSILVAIVRILKQNQI